MNQGVSKQLNGGKIRVNWKNGFIPFSAIIASLMFYLPKKGCSKERGDQSVMIRSNRRKKKHVKEKSGYRNSDNCS